MSAVALLVMAEADGVSLILNGDRLSWEADHEPPADLLADLVAQKAGVIAVLETTHNPPGKAWVWLGHVAELLGCTPEYLLKNGYLDGYDLAEQYQQPPSLAASLISSHPDWLFSTERLAQVGGGRLATLASGVRDQHSSDYEGVYADAHSSAVWLHARDAYHRHALGGCPGCYPRGNRHCSIGAGLRARYELESQALAVSNKEKRARL